MTPHVSTPYLWIPVMIILLWALVVLVLNVASHVGAHWFRGAPQRHRKFQKVIQRCLRVLLVK